MKKTKVFDKQEYTRLWKQQNPERVRQEWQNWYAQNRPELLKRYKRYNKNNKMAVKIQRKEKHQRLKKEVFNH